MVAKEFEHTIFKGFRKKCHVSKKYRCRFSDLLLLFQVRLFGHLKLEESDRRLFIFDEEDRSILEGQLAVTFPRGIHPYPCIDPDNLHQGHHGGGQSRDPRRGVNIIAFIPNTDNPVKMSFNYHVTKLRQRWIAINQLQSLIEARGIFDGCAHAMHSSFSRGRLRREFLGCRR